MSTIKRFFLRSPAIIQTAIEFIRQLEANPSKPLVLTIGDANRSLEQNAKFHALCSDFAKGAEFAGRKLTLEQWKTILISGHAKATGIGADLIFGIEGELVNIRESSANMGIKRMSSLIEYCVAYAVTNGIPLSDEKIPEPPEWCNIHPADDV